MFIQQLASTWIKRGALWCAAGVCAAIIASPAIAKTYTMKLSLPTINDMQHEWTQMFKEKLEAQSDGQIRVQIYPANQLGPITAVFDGMQLGSIEAVITPFEFYTGIDPRFQVTAVPGAFSSMHDARAKLDDETVRKTLLSIGEDKGIVGIAAVVSGPQVIASRKPTSTISDFSKQKIRVSAAETEMAVMSGLGASGVPMALHEVTSGLQQGTVDAASSMLDVLVSLQTAEIAPHAVETGFWYTILFATVSKLWLDTLPEDLRAMVFESAQEAEKEMFHRQLERQAENRERWTAAGGKLVMLPEDEQEQARQIGDQVAQAFLDKNPEIRTLYDMILAVEPTP